MLAVASSAYAAPPAHPILQELGPGTSEIFPGGINGQPPESIYFGYGLAIDGNTLLVGEPQAIPPRVAVFTRSSGTAPWKRSATFNSPSKSANSDFGRDIALNGNAALIASSESVYVFHHDAAGWKRMQRVAPPSSDHLTTFPIALALHANTAVITGSDAQGGIAYVYGLKADGTLSFRARLRSQTGVPTDGFGASVAALDNTVVIGAPGLRSTFVYSQTNSGWKRVQQVVPVESSRADGFGTSIALEGNTMVVGAPDALREGTTGELQSGAAYVFSKSNGAYIQRDVLHPSSAEHPDYEDYGKIVRLTHDRLVVWGHVEEIFSMGCCESLAFTYQRSGSNIEPFGIARGFWGAWNIATDGKELVVAGDEGRQYFIGHAFVYDIRSVE
jgi:hypothetical protein